MDYTVHGILQARILEWIAFPFSRGSSQPRDQTQVSCIAGRFSTSWATREALAWDVFCTRYPLILANYLLYMVLTFTALSSQTTPHSFFLFLHYIENATHKRQWTWPACQIQLLGYLMPAYDCFWNNVRARRTQVPYTFLITDPWLWALVLYNSLDSSWKGNLDFKHTVLWSMSLLSSPLCRLRIKDTCPFPLDSVSVSFIRLQWAEKAKTLAAEACSLNPWTTREDPRYSLLGQ